MRYYFPCRNISKKDKHKRFLTILIIGPKSKKPTEAILETKLTMKCNLVELE